MTKDELSQAGLVTVLEAELKTSRRKFAKLCDSGKKSDAPEIARLAGRIRDLKTRLELERHQVPLFDGETQ